MTEERRQGQRDVPRGENATQAILARLAAIILMAAVFFVLTISNSQADDRRTRAIAFLSSGTYTTATAYSTAFDVSAYSEAQLFIDVTAEAEASTLDVTIQVSPDNTTWYTHTAVAQITATGQYRTAITNFGNYLRIKYVVGGTSFTFSVTGVFKN